MPALPRRPFYKDRRPTNLGKLLNGTWAWVYSLGILPSFLVALEVKGRRSGHVRTNAVVLGDYDGDRYLVSMLGENVDWVRNVRASGEAVLNRRGRRAVRLEEISPERRAPILHAYYKRAAGARPHFDVSPHPTVDEFEPIAARHPVFRIIEQL